MIQHTEGALRIPWIAVVAFALVPANAEGQGEGQYIRQFVSSADSAFLDLCTGLDGIALVFKRHESGELAAVGVSLAEGVGAAAAVVGMSIIQRSLTFETITAPRHLEALHLEVGLNLATVRESLVAIATAAGEADCSEQHARGQACDPSARRLRFAEVLADQLGPLGAGYFRYTGIRRRVDDALQGGVSLPPFPNPGCLTIDLNEPPG